MVIAMAKKVWTGTQTAYDSLTNRPADDEFFTKVNETYSFNYNDVGDVIAINALTIENVVTIDANGVCTANSAFTGPSHSISSSYAVLNKMYRGTTGTSYKEYKFKYTDDGNSSSYDDVRAGSWVFIGYTTKTPATSGIRHRNLVETLPDVAHMTDSQIRTFLNGDYKNVLLVQIGDSTTAEELVDVQTISNANRTKYLYQT